MSAKQKRISNLGLLPMYFFTLVFVLGPLILMIALSFFEQDGFSYKAAFTLDNYKNALTGTYLGVLVSSLKLALISTAAVILLGYPFGLCTAFLSPKMQRFIMTTQMIPYWVNSLLRLYGWIIIFRANGLLDKLLMWTGLTDEPLRLLYTYPAVVVGMIYVLIPFMFASVYQVAQRLDHSLIEAARDLGAGRVRAFLTVTLPLTLPGLKTGIIHTFIPSMGLFFIADILGGNKIVLTGSLINDLLNKAHDQPLAAALATVLMVMTAALCILLLRRGKHER
ncbi:MAG: ABC transporter permease [Clostridia bacterium]|nr:ABC transporter permease [Clostridia bacterium]